jgi:hypothetical protein
MLLGGGGAGALLPATQQPTQQVIKELLVLVQVQQSDLEPLTCDRKVVGHAVVRCNNTL